MGFFGIKGLTGADVVGVATDALTTETQKEIQARVRADLDAKDLQAAAPEDLSAGDRKKLGLSAPDRTQGFAPANASQFTAQAPLKA